MKKQMKLYLSLILSVSFIAVGLLCYKNVNASTDDEDNIYTYAEYNATYKETKAIPTDNVGTDTVFAGWYLDANFTEPVKASTTLDSEAEGNVYAKFVDKELLTLRLQLDADLASNLTAEYTSYMRLLTSVDSLNYQKVEFIVNGTPYTITEVYSSVQGYKDGSNNSYTPQQTFGSEDAYRFAVMTLDEIQNLPATDATDHLGISLTVTPRWTTLDGTVVTGKEKAFEINDFLYEAEINDTLTGATDGTAHCWGTVEGAVSTVNSVGSTEKAIVVTVLKNAAIKQLNISKSMQLVNVSGKNITLSRSTDNTVQNWINVKESGTNLTIGSEDENGLLIVDGTITCDGGKPSNRIVVVNSETTFVLNKNASLENANATSGISGAAISSSGTATINGTIKNNTSSEKGGAIYNSGTLTVNGTIQNNSSSADAGAIYNTGTLTINGTVQENSSTGGVGAIYNSGILTVNGTIQNNSSSAGAGAIENAGTITLKETAVIQDNTSTTDAGAILQLCVSNGTNSILIEGGTYSDNKGVYGGVIASEERYDSKVPGLIEIKGGTFEGNTATYGGVACVYNTATGMLFEVTGGTFQNNTATAGGAFYVATSDVKSGYRTKLNIGAAIIQNNTADTESTTVATGGGAIFILGLTEVTLTKTTISNNTAKGKAGCDIAFNGFANGLTTAQNGRLKLKNYESFDGIIGHYGELVSNSTLEVYIDSSAITDYAEQGEKYLTTVGDTPAITPVVAEYYTDKGYYYGTVNDALTEAQQDSTAGTGDKEAIVITVLKDADITSQLAISKNIQLVNASEKIVTLSPLTTVNNGYLINQSSSASFTFGSNDETETGAIVLDGSYTKNNTKQAEYLVNVQAGCTFVLGRNATIQNYEDAGTAIFNKGTVQIFGTLHNNQTTGANKGGALTNEGTATICEGATFTNNHAPVGGAILQRRIAKGANCLIVKGGTFRSNTADTHGGAIAMEEPTGYYPGPVTIEDGIFESNTAIYGGAVSVYSRTEDELRCTVTGGTFQNNIATAGGAFYVDTYSTPTDDGTIYRTVLYISGAEIKNNEATTESTTANAGGGAIFMLGHTRVILDNVIISGNTAEGKAGCDIVFSTSSTSENGDLRLNNYESFDGIIGYYGANNIEKAAYVQTNSKLLYLEYGKSYNVDYTGDAPALNEITAQ